MSDETTTRSGPQQMSVHNCIKPGCKKWGSFGYDRGRGATDWWCFEHVPRDDAGERRMSY